MFNEFRFLVMCRFPSKDGGKVILEDIINNIVVPKFPATIEMFAVVGAIVRPELQGKRLDLMAWQVGMDGSGRQKLDGYVGTPLIIEQGAKGAVCMPYPIKVPVSKPGIYGFDLFDREGAFGKPASLLATYLYAVDGGA